MEVSVYNESGAVVGKVALREDVWNVPMNEKLVHQVVKIYLTNQRHGTASTKTRGEVSGGGKKPWRQKGTGRARHGSTRSPIWRTGGITFGPKPRDYSQSISKQARRTALKAALSDKVRSDALIVLQDITFTETKTKKMAEIIKNLKIKNEKVLLCLMDKKENVLKSARNIENVHLKPASSLNVYEVLGAKKLLVTAETVKKIEELYSGNSRKKEKAA